MSKVVVVTGGSQGIGAEIVRVLARNGEKVILNYNKSEEAAKKIQDDLASEGFYIDIYQADVSKHIEVTKLINFCIDKYHTIDVLINNAGICEEKLFTDITDLDWERMISTNLSSAFYAIKDSLPCMIHNKSGLIINISSVYGMVGASCETHYAVSKAGLDAMTKSLAKELGPSGIRVNSIAPGAINTKMNSFLSEEEVKELENEIPLGKIGSTSSIAKCVTWLLEDDYTTGQVISVNGGWVIS